jgi:acyl carrier protein
MVTADRVIQIISETLRIPVERVTPQASFSNDLGADSLDLTDLVIAIEQRLGVRIPAHHVSRLETVGDAIEYICPKSSAPDAVRQA